MSIWDIWEDHSCFTYVMHVHSIWEDLSYFMGYAATIWHGRTTLTLWIMLHLYDMGGPLLLYESCCIYMTWEDHSYFMGHAATIWHGRTTPTLWVMIHLYDMGGPLLLYGSWCNYMTWEDHSYFMGQDATIWHGRTTLTLWVMMHLYIACSLTTHILTVLMQLYIGVSLLLQGYTNIASIWKFILWTQFECVYLWCVHDYVVQMWHVMSQTEQKEAPGKMNSRP